MAHTDYEEFEYEYDIKDSHSIFHWEELIPTVIVYGLTLVLGLAGNCLIVFTTYRYRRMQSATNIFLTSLASADLLLIVFCIPIKVAKLFSYTWAFGQFLCKCVHYLQNVSSICSVLTLTAISVERYYAIVHPMRAKYVCTLSQAKRVIIFIWLLSILLAVPILFVQIQMPVGERYKAFWCVRNWDNLFLWQLHEVYMLFLVLIVPFVVMTFTYCFICWEVWRVMERRSVMTSKHALSRKHVNRINEASAESFQLTESKVVIVKNGRDDSQMVKQVICMLVAVVILFAISWSPLLIDNVLTAYGLLPKQRQGSLKYMATAFHLMAYFNSCINPIIYGFMSKSFRESFVSALCCTNPTRNSFGYPTNSTRFISRTGSQTRNTSIK